MAYRAVLKPVEGTILTVMREMSEGAQVAASTLNSYEHLLAETSAAAKPRSPAPTLLDKLRDAGVVDAGGQGLYVLVDGLRRYAEGEDVDTIRVDDVTGPLAAGGETPTVHVEHGEYGYCTSFLLVGGGWDFDEVRARIASLGESAVIVGDDAMVKVHITEAPGTVLNYVTALGSLRQISIMNMQDQHEDFLDMHGHEAKRGGSGCTPRRTHTCRAAVRTRPSPVHRRAGRGLRSGRSCRPSAAWEQAVPSRGASR